MTNYKRYCAALLCAIMTALTALPLGAYAEDGQSDTETVISGTLGCGHSSSIGVRIMAPGKTADDLSAAAKSGDKSKLLSVMPYQNQLDAGDGGAYSFAADLGDTLSGVYTVYIGCKQCGAVDTQSLLHSNKAEKDDAFALLNQAISEDDAAKTAQVYSEHKYALSFVSAADSFSTDSARTALLHRYLKDNFGKYTADDVHLYYSRAAIAAGRNNAAFTNLFDFTAESGLDRTDIGGYLKSDFMSDNLKAHATAHFRAESDAALATYDGFAKALRDSFILALVRYPDGYGNLTKVLPDFKSYIGYNNLTDEIAAYIGGKDYATVPLLAAAINSYSPSQGGGGGTGGGGGGGSSTKISGGAPIADPVSPISKDIFDDIADVPWAKDAIISLAQMNVINGKGDMKFCPNDAITREEAVKIIAAAFLGGGADGASTAFADVDPNAWYAPYVAKASERGAVNGISADTFGVGMNITRQDMAVICAKVYSLSVPSQTTEITETTEIPFGDDADIADYARDGVYLLKKLGIVNGDNNGMFNPRSPITRAEAAKLIYGLYTNV